MRSQHQLTPGRRFSAVSVVSAIGLFALVQGLTPPGGGSVAPALGARNETALSAEAQLRAAERICRGTLTFAKCDRLAATQTTL